MKIMMMNPLVMLDALASSGCVLPTEVSATLETSLQLKRAELGAKEFWFWGKISTTGGKDYFIGQTMNGAKEVDGVMTLAATNKYYYSQDGVNWLDLEKPSAEQMQKAVKLEGWLTGDPAHTFTVYEPQPLPEPEPVPEVAEGEEPPAPVEPEPLPDLEFPVSELEYLYCTVAAIDFSAFAMPANMMTIDAKADYVYNPEFPGVQYPDKLSSFKSVRGVELSKDIPGKWGLVHDSFKQLSVIRNLEYPGAFSYYSAVTNSAGKLYFGSGLKNKDLAFCV